MDGLSMEILRSRLMLARATHNHGDEMTALADIAHHLSQNGEFEDAVSMLQQSLDIARELNDEVGLIVAHWGLADIAHLQEDQEEEVLQLSQVVAAHLMAGLNLPKGLKERLEDLIG